MNRILQALLYLLASFFLVLPLHAQTIRAINFADVFDTSLDQIILADIDAAAEGEHLIYELERGFPFLLEGSIEFDGDTHLEIRSQDGGGAPPIILQGVSDGGEVVDQLFRIRGETQLTLRDIQLTGRTDQGAYNDRIVRTSGTNVVVMDNCIIDEVGQSVFRVNGGDEKIYITNCVINRIGRPNNPDNGRFVDNRSDNIDTIVIQNNLVTNVTSRFWRNQGGSQSNYVEIVGNTFMYSGQHAFDINVVNELIFHNNIVADPIFFGRTTDAQADPADARFVIELDTFINDQMTVDVRNNNLYVSETMTNSLPEQQPDGDTLITIEGFYFSAALQEGMMASGSMGTNIVEELDYILPPVPPIQFQFAATQDTTSGNEVPEAEPWDLSNIEEYAPYSGTNLGSEEPIARYIEFYNLCYNDDAQSATGATDGSPLGGQVTPACLVTSVDEQSETWGVQVFPNPTSGLVDIRFDQQFERLWLAVFNSTGQLILRDQAWQGQHQLDLSTFPNGTYFVRLQNEAGDIAVQTLLKQ
ncbi:MAG: T9SS type A sorting domain-containing protein [Bacteroidota bacterium]